MSQIKESKRTISNLVAQLNALASQIEQEDDVYSVTTHQNGKLTIRKRPDNTDYEVRLIDVYALATGRVTLAKRGR